MEEKYIKHTSVKKLVSNILNEETEGLIKVINHLKKTNAELLERLKNLVNIADVVGETENIGIMDEDIDKAKQAIAKAERE